MLENAWCIYPMSLLISVVRCCQNHDIIYQNIKYYLKNFLLHFFIFFVIIYLYKEIKTKLLAYLYF